MKLYRFIRGLCSIYYIIFLKTKVFGANNLLKDRSYILCINHISLLDPPFIGANIPRDICFMAKEELFKIPILGFLLKRIGTFPVKRGSGDVSAVKTAIRLLKEGYVLAMFPEGTRAKKGQAQEVKPGAALIAIKSKVPVIPIAIIGEYKLFSTMIINIGNQIDLQEYYDKKLSMDDYSEVSDIIMLHIKKLSEEYKN